MVPGMRVWSLWVYITCIQGVLEFDRKGFRRGLYDRSKQVNTKGKRL